jgi:hypothetical protein
MHRRLQEAIGNGTLIGINLGSGWELVLDAILNSHSGTLDYRSERGRRVVSISAIIGVALR